MGLEHISGIGEDSLDISEGDRAAEIISSRAQRIGSGTWTLIGGVLPYLRAVGRSSNLRVWVLGVWFRVEELNSVC